MDPSSSASYDHNSPGTFLSYTTYAFYSCCKSIGFWFCALRYIPHLEEMYSAGSEIHTASERHLSILPPETLEQCPGTSCSHSTWTVAYGFRYLQISYFCQRWSLHFFFPSSLALWGGSRDEKGRMSCILCYIQSGSSPQEQLFITTRSTVTLWFLKPQQVCLLP